MFTLRMIFYFSVGVPLPPSYKQTVTKSNPENNTCLSMRLFLVSCTLLAFTQNPLQELTSLLRQCKQMWQLKPIHAYMVTTGLIQQPPLAGKLIASCALNPSVNATSTARAIAGGVLGLDAYTWNTIIRGYLNINDQKSAILMYSELRRSSLEVDSYTLLYVIKVCESMPEIPFGEQIHSHVLKFGFASEVIIQTALINMYSSYGQLRNMRKVFDDMLLRDVVAWNSLVSAYSLRNDSVEALKVFRAMLGDNVTVTGVTAVSIISSCSTLRDLRLGKSVHGYLLKKFLDLDVFVHNGLIEMYSKCGSISRATQVFRSMPQKTVVSWTSMINGYYQNNFLNEALDLLREMESTNIKPDKVALLSAISLCSKLGRVELEDWINHWANEAELGKMSIPVANALIVMYSKCGNIKKAYQTFDLMEERTLVSWTAMIHGLATHGHGISALILFVQMLRKGLKPDEVLFLIVLFGCSHSGLVKEAGECFECMVSDFGIQPWMDHYGCMVDLFCRMGLVNEAVELASNMPMEADEIIYRMLLRACQAQGLSALAGRIEKKLARLGPRGYEDYAMLSNYRASIEDWDVVRELREEMEAGGAYKTNPGYSSVEVDSGGSLWSR